MAATIISIPMGVTPPVTDFSFAPDCSAFAAPFQVTPEARWPSLQVIVQPCYCCSYSACSRATSSTPWEPWWP
ncbi:MAG: hypothetical protein ACLTMP_07425 [Eggerthella lenta]